MHLLLKLTFNKLVSRGNDWLTKLKTERDSFIFFSKNFQPYKKIHYDILRTRNCITFICKKLHTFVKVSIKIIPISFWAGPIIENVNQM